MDTDFNKRVLEKETRLKKWIEERKALEESLDSLNHIITLNLSKLKSLTKHFYCKHCGELAEKTWCCEKCLEIENSDWTL